MSMMAADIIPTNTVKQAILEQYETILMKADRIFQDYVRNHSLKITCGPACSDCCAYYVPVYFIDAYYLQIGMQTLEFQKKNDIRRHAMENVSKIKRLEGIAKAIEEISTGVVQDARASLSYIMRHKIKCPFAGGQEGGCMVYRYRPLIDRCFGIPLKIWAEEYSPSWCDLNTAKRGSLPIFDACKLQREVEKLSRELEILLTGKIQPKFPIWFFAIFPVKKFIEKNTGMTDRNLYPEEQKFKVRQKLIKIATYSMPAIVTVLAVAEESCV